AVRGQGQAIICPQFLSWPWLDLWRCLNAAHHVTARCFGAHSLHPGTSAERSCDTGRVSPGIIVSSSLKPPSRDGRGSPPPRAGTAGIVEHASRGEVSQ